MFSLRLNQMEEELTGGQDGVEPLPSQETPDHSEVMASKLQYPAEYYSPWFEEQPEKERGARSASMPPRSSLGEPKG
jgi:hypothetical protein